jgi:hypothetical protein
MTSESSSDSDTIALPHPPDREDQEKGSTPIEAAAPRPSLSEFPDGGLKAWSVVVGGWCCLFCSYGWINVIGLFQTYYQEDLLPSYGPSTISWITSVEVWCSLFSTDTLLTLCVDWHDVFEHAALWENLR